jgi:predicted phosphoribosyltransferase
MPLFFDRAEAGIALGRAVAREVGNQPAIVLALPRGGVPVALGVAKAIRAPWDVFLVRKLGTPGREELAVGAISSGGIRVLNRDVIEMWQIPLAAIEAVASEELQELERRERIYRAGRPPLDIANRVAILVDDGLATGASMLAAIQAVRLRQPSRVMVAVPVAAREALEAVQSAADRVICLETPDRFCAVGSCYHEFEQVSDGEVCEMLAARRALNPASRE